MKKYIFLTLCAALMMPQASQAQEIIAGIDNFDSTTAPTVPVVGTGITATATASGGLLNWSINDSTGDPGRGSSGDTTWGTFDGGATPASAVTDVGTANYSLTNTKPTAEITFTITNGSGADVDVNSFHMDAIAFRPRAARTYTLRVLSGDLTNGDIFATEGMPMNDNSTNDLTHLGGALGTGHDVHEDLDLDLTGLADHTLADGESAVIQIEFTNGADDGSGGHHLFVDNVAFSTAITTTTNPVLLGDVDLNGTVEFLDIAPFIALLSGSTFQAEADCDEDGDVDFLDIAPFIAILAG